METLKIEVGETKNYKQRMKSVLLWCFPFIVAYGLFLYFSRSRGFDWANLISSLSICILFSSAIFLLSDIVCAYHICFLEIKENRVHIIYTKRDKKFELDDLIEKFEFSYGTGNLSAYIKIKYNDEIVARQHKVRDWKKEGVFDQTIKYLENRKLLGQSWGTAT